MRHNGRAQAWGFDIMVATAIFIFGIIVFFLYSLNYPRGSQDAVEMLRYEGNVVADELLTEGVPPDWTTSTVSRIGILSDHNINQTKLEEFYTLVQTNYGGARAMLRTKYHYFVNASAPLIINGTAIAGIGNQPSGAKNVIKITRVTVYDNKPLSLQVYVWE